MPGVGAAPPSVAPPSVAPPRGLPHVVVIGGGVCGLYAARVAAGAGLNVTVLERDDVVGGLAAGRRIEGNWIDLGTHHLHAFDAAIFDDVRAIMGTRLRPIEKLALVRYGRGFRRYPLAFGDLLRGIPPWTLARALFGLVGQQLVNRLRPRAAVDAEQALIALYGLPLYRFFFRDFTARYWGMSPRALSATFVRRKMPRLSAIDIVKRALAPLGFRDARGAAVDSALAEETLWYGVRGSGEMPTALAEHVEACGGRIITSAPVTAVETAGGRVVAVRYRPAGAGAGTAADDAGDVRLACDAVINTAPINHIVPRFDPPPPPDVTAAAAALRHRPMVAYAFLIRRPRVLNALYVYYRDRRFHRLAEPKNSGLAIDPPDHTLLLAELMCAPDDGLWRGDPDAVADVVRDLEAEGVCRADEIVRLHVVRAPEAYPVFDLGFEPHLEALQSFVARWPNAWSVGRQGGFGYPNMHAAMREGATAAEKAVAIVQAARAAEPQDEALPADPVRISA